VAYHLGFYFLLPLGTTTHHSWGMVHDQQSFDYQKAELLTLDCFLYLFALACFFFRPAASSNWQAGFTLPWVRRREIH
jgi:hypothetical protein